MLQTVKRQKFLRSIEEPWEKFLRLAFWSKLCDGGKPVPFSDFHRDFWRWIWSIEPGKRSRPFVAIWFRGGAKSTYAEMACVALGARRARNYVLYVSGSQNQADKHVQAIASLLDFESMARLDPDLCSRMISKYGHSRGWRRDRLHTASGFVVDALGLDTAARGIKVDANRPDFIVLDDIDDTHDSARMVEKKIKSITRKILPAGSHDMSVLAAQNLIHPDSIFARLEDGRADFLTDRIVSGPHPAVRDLKYEIIDGSAKIVDGTPTWPGLFPLEKCQTFIQTEGLDAFLVELQHERMLKEGGIVTDLWRDAVHVVKPFEIPNGWTVRRAFDWGSTKPFACLWSARSDGESPVTIHGTERVLPKGSVVVVAEDYGWTGKPNEGLRLSNDAIARRILNIEKTLAFGPRVRTGPADSSIFDVQNGESIAQDMARAGVSWMPAPKGPGSRINGAQQIRSMLAESLVSTPERPCLYFFEGCRNTIRTLKTLPRDPVKVDDVDTDAEDHIWDALRYEIMSYSVGVTKQKLGGY